MICFKFISRFCLFNKIMNLILVLLDSSKTENRIIVYATFHKTRIVLILISQLVQCILDHFLQYKGQ